MADINVNRTELTVRDLAAQVITLYPTRAHIVWSKRDVRIKASQYSNHQILQLLIGHSLERMRSPSMA